MPFTLNRTNCSFGEPLLAPRRRAHLHVVVVFGGAGLTDGKHERDGSWFVDATLFPRSVLDPNKFLV
jgi:hypothetical protein